MAAPLGRQHEHRLREADLQGEALHRLLAEPARVREDGELVALERCVGEDVGDDVALRQHGLTLPGVEPVSVS